MLVVTGGFVTTASGVRVSARSPIPAFTGAALALGLWLIAAQRAQTLSDDLAHMEAWLHDHVRWVVAVIAACALASAVAFHTFSAAGADASGYLSHAAMLVDGRLTRSEPLASFAQWADGEATLAPLGWRAIDGGVQVPTYAVGLPLLMAPFYAAGGDVAASLVVPLSLAVLICVSAALAHRAAGPGAAILAALWVATSPIALIESMQVMSDVPVTAAWLTAWWCVFRQQSVAAGIAAAVAVLIRPNLAPMAALPVLYLWSLRRGGVAEPGAAARSESRGARGGMRQIVSFAVPVAIAGAITAYLQSIWFGSPWRSGYGTAAEIYSLANVAPNTLLYGRWLVDTHGAWLLLAPIALALCPRGSVRRELIALFAFAALVVLGYLVYAQFEVWTYLRFMLPALAVATIAVAAVVALVRARFSPIVRAPMLVVVALAVAGANVSAARQHDVFRLADRSARARVVGARLAGTLPVNAAIVSGEQSGAMRHYTGRSILRWDLMDGAAMTEALERLTLNGYQVWVVLDDWEEEAFRRKLPALAAMSLDYEPAVESAAGVGIRTRAWRARRLIARSSNNE